MDGQVQVITDHIDLLFPKIKMGHCLRNDVRNVSEKVVHKEFQVFEKFGGNRRKQTCHAPRFQKMDVEPCLLATSISCVCIKIGILREGDGKGGCSGRKYYKQPTGAMHSFDLFTNSDQVQAWPKRIEGVRL